MALMTTGTKRAIVTAAGPNRSKNSCVRVTLLRLNRPESRRSKMRRPVVRPMV
jgi:hypothetical protein